MRSRPCKRRDGFTWSRTARDGSIVYRLFWRAPSGRIHCLWHAYVAGADRGAIACDLWRLKRNMRVIVDAYRVQEAA